MKSYKKRFYIWAIIVLIVISSSFFLQYLNNNNLLVNNVERMTEASVDVLNGKINNWLNNKGQLINVAKNYIEMGEHTDEEILEYLEVLLNENEEFFSIYYGTKDNSMINASGWEMPEGFDLRERPWYKKAVKQDQLIYTNSFINASEDDIIITVAVPVYNKTDDELLGVVAGDVSISTIISYVKEQQVVEKGFFMLIDNENHILAHPDFDYNLNNGLPTIEEKFGENSQINQFNINEVKKIKLNDKEGFFSYKKVKNTQWRLANFTPLNYYTDSFNQLLRSFLFAFILSLLVIFTFLWFQNKYVIKPLRRFDSNINNIDLEKNLDYRLPISTNNVFKFLSESINNVLEKTQNYFQKLKASEQKLKMEKENLRTTLHSIGDAVISTDIKGRVVRINPVAEKLTGWKMEDAIGKPIHKVFNIVNAKTRKKVENPVDKVLEEKKVVGLANHTVLIAKDGSEYQIADSASPIINDEDEITGVVLVFRDVTEKYIMQEKLKYSQKMYKTIFNSAPIGILIENDTGGILKVNEAECEMTGYTKEELEGSNVIDKFVIPENQESARNNIKNILNGDDIEVDIKTPKKNGEIVYTHLKETSITFPDGNKGIISMHNNITERKKAKEALKKSEKRYKAIFENTGTATFIIEKDKTISMVNKEFEELSGYNKEEVEGNIKWTKFIVPEDLEKMKKYHKARRKEGETAPTRYEFRFVDRDKEKHHILLDIDMIPGTNKSVASLLDITERKKAEEEVKQSEQRLDSLISNTPAVIYSYNVNDSDEELTFDTTYINDNIQNVLGFAPDDFFGQEEFHKSCIHPDDRERLFEEIQKLIKGETDSIIITFRFKDSSGNYHWLRDSERVVSREDKEMKVFGAFWDITERKQAEEQLQYKTFHDELTGLYNRAYFEEELNRYDNKRQLPLSIIMGDVNGLKIANDTFGHKEGDKLLKRIAQIIENSCRQEDLVARIGGDEFVVLLPQTSKKEAEKIYERIKVACQKAEKDPIKPSIALGGATKKETTDDFETVLKKAEDKMYQNKVHESPSVHNTILDSLETMLRETTNETLEHSQRLKDLAVDLGKRLNLSRHKLDVLASLADLHDLGKVAISKNILQKPCSLNSKEWEEVKRHPEIGYKIASSSSKLNEIAEGIYCHHEHWDGDGYPQGLAGEEIPLLARIISIVDAYDVMTNGRPYKEPMSKEEALAEISDCAGSQFDPELVEEFIELQEAR
ncbi:MAG: PAS domain S-box protein [Halanaerobiales bacterium]|nr:PAS domain S-box protein [Halanaerobiales bacterium]